MTVVPHHRVTFSGVYGLATGPVENWTFGLSTPNDPTNTTPAQLATLATAAKTAFVTHLKPLFHDRVRLVQVRVASLDASGRVNRTANGGYVQGDWLGDEGGSGTPINAGPMSTQTALVASLMTGRAGPAGKGRIFLPWPETVNLGSDFRISTTAATTIATAVKSFIAAVNTGLGTTVQVSGASSVKTGKEATLSPVTGVRVGRVPDTQRSRRGKSIEGYVSLAL